MILSIPPSVAPLVWCLVFVFVVARVLGVLGFRG